jgi:hypothetical protein
VKGCEGFARNVGARAGRYVVLALVRVLAAAGRLHDQRTNLTTPL